MPEWQATHVPRLDPAGERTTTMWRVSDFHGRGRDHSCGHSAGFPPASPFRRCDYGTGPHVWLGPCIGHTRLVKQKAIG